MNPDKVYLSGAFGKIKSKEGISMETETEILEQEQMGTIALKCWVLFNRLLKTRMTLTCLATKLSCTCTGALCFLSVLLMPCRPSAQGVSNVFSNIHFALWKMLSRLTNVP